MPTAPKAQAQATRKKRWKYALYAALLLSLGYFFIGGDDGLGAIRQQRLELAIAEERLEHQRARRDSLALVLQRLQTDLDYIEKIAREELGMVKKGERLYYVRTPKNQEER